MPLLRLVDVRKYFPGRRAFLRSDAAAVKAVDGVSLSVRRGETLGLVGESGCGKSTLGRCILHLAPPTGGQVLFDGQDLATLSAQEMRQRRREMQIVFQDPYSALNPRKTVGSILTEAYRIHGLYTPSERMDKARALLDMVGLRTEHIHRYPHEFSGGQRQRICIARAIALDPKLIVADEAVSALDVSVQAQVLNLMVTLQKRLGLTYVFISHDLRVVRHISDRVGVMYLGRLVELSDTASLYRRPLHPYSEALLSALPRLGPRTGGKRIVLKGDMPSPVNPPSGCAFHPRCPQRRDRCAIEAPDLREHAPGRLAACHYPLLDVPASGEDAAQEGAARSNASKDNNIFQRTGSVP
ncbi:dipeptide ABC transporter ATP-binding protein [Ancylobacter sonchi]|uniref:ABC transporter ATP-binding protein n=1 Tax=Ancylobacter sonchi TaxID=1937790 RepID=UPI001BD1E228|nr:dipeptide ABC transporter ATP-binding protein [Ancylobacter sonchi]MBS7535276.1 dipeptide ABC transporter ATP-binding protein [Ancylobacter sonchi]